MAEYPKRRIRVLDDQNEALVPSGSPDHVSGGEISAPSQVCCVGTSRLPGSPGWQAIGAWPSPPTCPGVTLQIDKNPFHGETIDEPDAYVIAASLAAGAGAS
jgi:hypothetical protein